MQLFLFVFTPHTHRKYNISLLSYVGTSSYFTSGNKQGRTLEVTSAFSLTITVSGLVSAAFFATITL